MTSYTSNRLNTKMSTDRRQLQVGNTSTVNASNVAGD